MAQGAKKARQAPADLSYRIELAGRIAKAFGRYNADAGRADRLTQEMLGKVVAQRLGRPTPFTQGAVSSWMNTDDPGTPDNPTIRAIAEVLGVDVMWLILGARED
jgi:transcriptional regulator with XRE-family HTH domain